MSRAGLSLRAIRAQPWAAVGLAVVLAVIGAGKHHYRAASPEDLDVLLAPTAWLVSFASGMDFTREAGVGWISREAAFIIAPGCAGMNFALAAFLALAAGWRRRMRDARSTATTLAQAAAFAYAAALAVNTVRITLAMALHRGAIDLGGLDPDEVHRVEGIAVYLGGLCAVYAACGALGGRGERRASPG